jgi:hypothetical protein
LPHQWKGSSSCPLTPDKRAIISSDVEDSQPKNVSERGNRFWWWTAFNVCGPQFKAARSTEPWVTRILAFHSAAPAVGEPPMDGGSNYSVGTAHGSFAIGSLQSSKNLDYRYRIPTLRKICDILFGGCAT